MNLFAYGTLMVPRLMAAITGSYFSYADAILKDYARYGVTNAPYPGLVFERDACTRGVVYFDIDTGSLHRMDRYEDDYYGRIRVGVDTSEKPVPTETYVFKAAFRHLLSDSAWNPETFRQTHLERYIERFGR